MEEAANLANVTQMTTPIRPIPRPSTESGRDVLLLVVSEYLDYFIYALLANQRVEIQTR